MTEKLCGWCKNTPRCLNKPDCWQCPNCLKIYPKPESVVKKKKK